MSKYARHDKAKYTNIAAIKAALEDTYGVGNVEVHPQGQIMFGYAGQKLKAHVIVRKSVCGGYGDMGFVKENGYYIPVIDDMLKFDLKSFSKKYVEKVIASDARLKSKYRVLGETSNGIRVQVR